MSKVEKIKAEIERRLEKIANASSEDNRELSAIRGAQQYELINLVQYIDTLEEEPVSEDLEKACDEYYDETWDEHGGKAMVVDGCHDIWFPSQATDDFFKAGAQWQKEQLIDKAIKWLEDNMDRYLYNTGGYGEYIPKCGGKMFEDFKKAMEK